MLRRLSLAIVSFVVVISMVFGPLVSSVQAAQKYEAAQEAAELLAPSERFNNWPYPQSPEDELNVRILDATDAALESITNGFVDADLFSNVSRVEIMHPSDIQNPRNNLPAISAVIPVVVDPLSEIQITAEHPQSLQAFADFDEELEGPYDTTLFHDTSNSTTSSPSNLFSVFDSWLNHNDSTALHIPTPEIPVEEESISETSIQAETENLPYTIMLPLILKGYEPTIPTTNTEITITPSIGGVLQPTNGAIRITLSAGSVVAPTRVQYMPGLDQEAIFLPGMQVLQSFSLSAQTVADGSSVQSSFYPFSIELQQEIDADVAQHYTLMAWTGTRWQSLPTIVDVDNQILQAQTQRLSTFAVVVNETTSDEAVQLAPHIPAEPSTNPRNVFYANTTTYNYTDGPVTLSSTKDGTGELWTDDAVRIVVNRSDGSQKTYFHDYTAFGPGITITPPEDVTDYFLPGANEVYIEVWDYNVPSRGTSGYYLVATEAITDTIPPVIHYIDKWQAGNGQVIIQAYVTDNVGVGDVTLMFNGQEVTMQPIGGGLYEAAVSTPINALSNFHIVAVDYSLNAAVFPDDGQIDLRGYLSRKFGWNNFGSDCPPGTSGCAGDPVNTANGNYTDHFVDLTVLGVGESDIVVERGYNSLSNEPQGVTRYTMDGDTLSAEPFYVHPEPFGSGWTFAYGIQLLIMDYLNFTGLQVRYADGRTALFEDNGNGSYSTTEPRSHDKIIAQGGSYVLQQKDLTKLHFDADGRLTQIVDPNGNVQTLTYSGEKLNAVTNDSGRTVTFEYNGEGQITDIYAPEGRHLHYEYEDGLLTAYTNGNQDTTYYQYNDEGQLTAIITPEGHPRVRMEYDDELGRVTEQTVGATQTRTFDYDDDARITTVTDVYNNQTVHFYDEAYRLIESQDAQGRLEFYGYDDDDNRNYFKDREGHEWYFNHDDRGNALTEDGPLGWHREAGYNALDLVTRLEDSEERVTYFEYDSQGNLKKIITPEDDISTITYDARGLPVDIMDFNGNHIINTYAPVTGDLIEMCNGAGDTFSYAYDDLGRVHSMTDGIDATYFYAYDGNDNLIGVAGPLNYHLGYGYDKNDNLKIERDPNSGETEYFYDGSDNLIRVENQMDSPTYYDYDAMDNLTRIEDAESRVWTFDYDEVYDLVAEHGPEDTHAFYTYDAVGNLTDMARCNSPLAGDTCPVQQVTHYEFDDLDRVVERVENYRPGFPKSADTNVTTTYEYDLVGNVLVLTDANDNPTFYEYDDLSRLIWEKNAEDKESEYGYDGNGNLTSFINPRDYETTYTYDGANRLETITYPNDAATWTYAYDGNGNLITMADPHDVVTLYEYDLLNRLASITENYVPGAPEATDQNVTTGFDYDLAGNLRFVYDPRGDYETEHLYDPAHRRTITIDAEDGETEFLYDDVSNLTHIVNARNYTTTIVYDELDRQTTITNPEGHSISFDYDRLGNLLVLTDARQNETTFTYDGMNRVTLRVDAMDGEWRYEYDAMGNLLRHEDANHHFNNTYTYDKVYRVLSITDAENHTTSLTYDDNGNRLTLMDGNDNITDFTYDEVDRLASMTNAMTETTTYHYDLLGNQAQMIENDGVVTLYTYDPLYRLSAVTLNYRPGEPESAVVNADTHYGYDEVGNLVSILDAEEHETRFFYDGLNRLVQEVDAEDNTWDYEYDPVGNCIVRVDANRNRTEYTYYPDDQLEHISYHDGTSVHYTYDENNNRLTMDDHLGTTTWVYDDLNRITNVTDPFGRDLGYAYDAVGNRIGLTYPDGRVVNYTYLKNSWLHTVVAPSGITVYERDGVGQVLEQRNPNSTMAVMTYDKANRLLTLRNYQVEGARKTNSAFTYTYDDVGQRIEVVAEYAWRKPNEIITSTYTYDPLRRLIRDEDSRGVWTDYTFDRVGNRLTLVTNDDSLSPRPFDEKTLVYTYNNINQVFTIVGDTHPGNPSTKRTDNVGQALHAFQHEVTAQRGKHITEAAADNLLAMVEALIADLYDNPAPDEGEVTAAIEALRAQVIADRDAGEIDNDGVANSLLVKLRLGDEGNNGVAGELQTTTFLYDANGNRINKEFPGPQGPRIQGTDYTYDLENRLVVAHDYQENLNGNRTDRQITRLEYDGGGRRLVKEYDPKDGGGGTKRVEYVFDGLDPVAEYNIWNPQYENFYRGDLGRILTMHHFPAGTQGQMYWFHYDGLGSTSSLTKQNGNSHHNYRYEPYGQIEMPPGNFTDPHNHYTFTGQELDENMGVYEFYARAYDYDAGVWLQQDVYRGHVSQPSSMHRTKYVHNNPVNYIDVHGYYAICVQQGFNKANKDDALPSMCSQLVNDKKFGASGEKIIVSNDAKGRKMAIEYLKKIRQAQRSGKIDPNEKFYLLGYSYGGAGALEFAWYLNDYGDACSYQTEIDRMVLVDAIRVGRNLSLRHMYKPFKKLPPSKIPDNVERALNLYATEDIGGGKLNPFDQGEQNISGADNRPEYGTNHCTIGYENCKGNVFPQGTSAKQKTIKTIENWLDNRQELLPHEPGYVEPYQNYG